VAAPCVESKSTAVGVVDQLQHSQPADVDVRNNHFSFTYFAALMCKPDLTTKEIKTALACDNFYRQLLRDVM
jgi:hypothetical protein